LWFWLDAVYLCGSPFSRNLVFFPFQGEYQERMEVMPWFVVTVGALGKYDSELDNHNSREFEAENEEEAREKAILKFGKNDDCYPPEVEQVFGPYQK
jgi:hypothetical protein